MGTSRDILRERFRAVCAERVREVRRLLHQADGPGSHGVRYALGELHTIKGESAMVGLETLSRLAHALESLVIRRRESGQLLLADVDAALALVEQSLAEPWSSLAVSPTLADLLVEVELAVAGDAAAAGVSLAPPPLAPVARPEPPSPHSDGRQSPAVERRGSSRWMHVDGARVDALCETLGETTLSLGRVRAALVELTARRDIAPTSGALRAVLEQLDAAIACADDVAESAWALRLVPLEPVLLEVFAHAESLGAQQGKPIDIALSAAGVELERAIIDELREPLLHLVRNAVDHGVERPDARAGKPPRGRLRCAAEAQAASVLIRLEDDGAGIDPEAVRARALKLGLVEAERAAVLSPAELLDLIFLPGFTRCDQLTELSGRGVGLHVARRTVEALGGTIQVRSSPGQGTRFDILLPTTLSRERVLLVEAGEVVCGVPARWVRAVLRDPETLAVARERGVVRHAGKALAVRSLAAWLGVPDAGDGAVLVLEIGEQESALAVSRALHEHDLLRHPADALLAWAARLSGSGVLDDGRLVLLPRWAEVQRDGARRALGDGLLEAGRRRKARVLVVDDSPVVRDIVGDILSGAGLTVELAENGAAALERVSAGEIDLVLSDVEMPRMNGFELLERIRARSELLPVVMLTTRSSADDRRRAAALGANAYVVKSEFHGDTLLDVVRRFVELPRS